MRKNIPWDAESLDDNTWRCAVIGGWIVYGVITSSEGHVGITSTFVKDIDHEWKIKKPEDHMPPALHYEAFGSPTL